MKSFFVHVFNFASKHGSEFEMDPGGKGANQAVAAAALLSGGDSGRLPLGYGLPAQQGLY